MRMRPSVVLDMKRSAVREAVGRFRAANPRVFGSVLHGTDQDSSDPRPVGRCAANFPRCWTWAIWKKNWKSLLGVDVDLLTPGDLPPKFGQTGARGGATDMSENRLPDYLDHIQQGRNRCAQLRGRDG